MPRLIRITYGLTGLLVLYLLNPAVAWLVVGGGLAYFIGQRGRRSLGRASVLS